MCDDMLTIDKSCMRKEIVECMSDPAKAKAHAGSDKNKKYAVLVRMFASGL